MSKIYLYFYKKQNSKNFFFHDSKDYVDSLNNFDALISEIDIETWKNDAKNYPNPQFPLPGYILEGFRGPMYDLLKESADHSYDDLNRKNLKVDIALFMLNDYHDTDIKEYDDYFSTLKEIKYSFNCLNNLLKNINNIDDFYDFKVSILQSFCESRTLNKICEARKILSLDTTLNISSETTAPTLFTESSDDESN